ncbi:MAG: alpha/beta hydrolase [Theionarchaea archaeon]|nr:alpha/beta hydrolase [Theionarchaea archaeon]
MTRDKDRKIKEKYGVETGYFEEGLPYACIGTKPTTIVNIDGLSFSHEPPSGFVLKQFIKSSEPFTEDYSFYLVGRKPNLPEGYLFSEMAEDYARMIRREFRGPVHVIGVSTGGQLAHYLAADHPDVVNKLVIISAAYRLSEEGVEIERRSAEYYMQGKYGKALAAIMDMMHPPGFKRRVIKLIIQLIGSRIIGHVEFPNDLMIEVQADREMDFRGRLGEIKAPTLIIAGELDHGYSIEDVCETAKGIPNARLITYKDYGHDLMMNNRKQVQNDILKFLES